jgi:type I restriction enzyme, S subunit
MDSFKETKIGLIPNEWDLIKSKDFCVRVTDGTHDTPTPQTDGYYLVTSKNLVDSQIDFSSCYCISEQDFKQINQRSGVEQFDVLFGMIGTVGNTAIIEKSEIDFAIKNVGLFKLNKDYDKAVWLKNFFSSNIFSNYLKRQMAGTTQQFVGLCFLRKAPIIIPKKDNNEIDWVTVKGINHILSKVDEAIAATQNSIKAAEKLKKALMQNLLTGKLKPDGSWRTEDEFYEDEKFGKVPMGWEVKRLGQIGGFMNGVNFSNSQLGKGYPFINLKDIYNNKIIDCSKLDKVEINKLNGLKLFKGDIVFVRSSVKPSGIGWSALFNGNTETTIFCGFVIKYTFDQSIVKPEYLIELLLSEPVRNKIIALGQVVANTNINQRALKGLLIIFPKDLNEQTEVYSKINSFDVEIQTKQTKIQTLQRLKKSLMQNLLTGKVRLPQEFISQFENSIEELNKREN